jgi:hypothetical protein
VQYEFDLVFDDAMNTAVSPATGNLTMNYSVTGSDGANSCSWTDANTLHITTTTKPSNGESATFEYAYIGGNRLQFADGSPYPEFEIDFTVSF